MHRDEWPAYAKDNEEFGHDFMCACIAPGEGLADAGDPNDKGGKYLEVLPWDDGEYEETEDEEEYKETRMRSKMRRQDSVPN
ncbi:hypothetical protein MMC21_000985 [Puttea exsequens]|nr:hypothetical protein [Puttea exsequens]